MSERLAAVALASASPRRLFLLESLGLRVTVIRSAYRERSGASHEAPRDLALRHALGKAAEASADGPPVVVAADTIVDVDGESYGKPRDAAEAAAMLSVLSGRWHVVHTGFAVTDRRSGTSISGVESSKVKFVMLSEAAIDRYVASGEPLDKAGAYGIQGIGALLVERIEGDFYTVMGLPLARLGDAWRRLGYEIP